MAERSPESQAEPSGFRGVQLDVLFSLLDKLPLAAYACDPAGFITYCNEQAIQLWGRAPKFNDPSDRFCGSFKLFAADGTPIRHDERWMALALLRGKEYNGEEIIVERADGTRVTVLAHANPIRDEHGEIIAAINLLVDISDRKQAEQARAILASIVDSSEDAIVSKTLDGRIQSWNAGAERLFGYTAAEAIGSPIALIIPPERRDEELAILAKLKRGERIEHYETIRVSKSGRRMNISLSISPVLDSGGRVIGASKVARDITAQRQSQESLVTLRDELAAQLADLRRLHEMTVRLSTTLEMEPILEETLRTAAALEGADMGLVSLTSPDHGDLVVRASLGFKPEFLATIERVQPGTCACGVCYLERRRVIVEDVEIDPIFDGALRAAAREAGFRAVHSTPLITRSGKIVGVLSTHFRRPHRPSDRETHLIDLCARQAVDFIENARLYDELRESDRRKDEFLATLAHELRNPLAPISNSLEILRLSDDLSPGAEHVRDIMERQVNHMVRLVDDLLEVSRITRGKIDLRKERVELVTVLRSAVETSRPLIEAAQHQLAITISPEAMTLEADPVRLAQVIANILNNAAKYTEPGGQIWLTARRDGQEAAVSIRDNGLGIPTEMLPRIFDMFSQVDRTLKRAQGGLGIGLTLAKNLVQMHGGRIDVHSGGVGQGSEFVVTLPLVSDICRPATMAGSTLPRSEVSKAMLPARRILIVDDARDSAYVLSKLLGKMGQQVEVAQDALAGFERARAWRPDVVISDIAMPEVDGYELARRLRQEPGLEGLVLVALTGYGQEHDRLEAKNAGFDHHLVKPIGLEALEELLAGLPGTGTEGDHKDTKTTKNTKV